MFTLVPTKETGTFTINGRAVYRVERYMHSSGIYIFSIFILCREMIYAYMIPPRTAVTGA